MLTVTEATGARKCVAPQVESASLTGAAMWTEVAEEVTRACRGDDQAIEASLLRFRPLLLSKAHRLWGELQSSWPALEWSDVESQVQLFFLVRLQAFRPDAGVYFTFYIERMLDLDCRAWLRSQRKSAATPFSQIGSPEHDFEDESFQDALLVEADNTEAESVEQKLALNQSLAELSSAHRYVVWQCCLRGRTEEDVAHELGVSRSTVRNQLAAALDRLRALLDPDTALAPGILPTRTGRARPLFIGMRGKAQMANAPPANAPPANAPPANAPPANVPVTQQRREFWDFWLEKMKMAKHEHRPDLVGVGAGRVVLLQGTFDFPATGLKTPQLLSPKLRHEVAPGCVLGVRYARVGVICPQMTVISTVVNGLPHRLIPVAANATMHVALAIVDPLCAGSQIEIHIASDAPGTAIIDVGCLQMPA